MNNITPKEAIANLNHIYGMVAPDFQRSLDVAIKALERPQGDLISRDALKEAIKDNGYSHYFEIFDIIDNAQAIPLPNEQIAWEQGYEAGLAQGKQDRPKGEWIKIDEEWYDYKCSVCGEKVRRLYPFCHCGADMRKGDAE